MCEVCHHDPCTAGPEPVHICSECKEGIYEGSKYFSGPQGPICLDCIKEMDPEEIFELLGESMSVA